MTTSVEQSYEYCRRLAKRTAGNFYYSFLTLSHDRFRGMCACTPSCGSPTTWGTTKAGSRLAPRPSSAGGTELEFAWNSGHSSTPCSPRSSICSVRRQVPLKYLHDVITGVEMDLGPVAFETFDQLAGYCYHVAGAVGLACIHLWGFHDERALAAAVDCGTALQLTNILRDLQEDARRGRVYLPSEDLNRFDLDPEELGGGIATNGIERLMRFEVERAREYYARARRCSATSIRPAAPILETMLRIYGGLLDEIERRRYDVFTRRVELSCPHKLFIAGHALVRHKLRMFKTGSPELALIRRRAECTSAAARAIQKQQRRPDRGRRFGHAAELLVFSTELDRKAVTIRRRCHPRRRWRGPRSPSRRCCRRRI